MKKVFSPFNEAGSAELEESRLRGWNRNTDFCMDVKTLLRSDRITRIGKVYQGLLRLDDRYHYTFTETQAVKTQRRNPRIYDGRYVTLTLQADGSLRPNLRQVKISAGFDVDDYILGVRNELRSAFKGLVEESE